MNEQLDKDLNRLPDLLTNILQQSIAYLNQLDNYPTTSRPNHTLNNMLPATGYGAEVALQNFNQQWKPLIVASSGPRYLGYVTGGTTPASIMGDWLTSVYDQNTFAVKGYGDVSALIERNTVQLLLELFHLPKVFFGGFVTGATMSNFTCLAVARQWFGSQQNIDIARNGLTIPIKTLSATPHSSSVKALAMLGIGSATILPVKTIDGNREAMDINDLSEKLESNKDQPCIVISSGGTVNTVDFDDMQAIAQLKKTYSFWWHVDAAFGAFAACSPDHHQLLKGWEAADSITVDCHKWLNVPYDSAVFFVRQDHIKLQVETFQNSNAPYLGDPLEQFSYINFLPENSRRLRALPAWFSLMAYGKNGYKDIVENSIQLAKSLGKKIDQSEQFILLAPVRLNTVCFTLATTNDQNKRQLFLDRLNANGKVFMTPTIYNKQFGFRAAFVNWRSTEADIDIIWKELYNALEER